MINSFYDRLKAKNPNLKDDLLARYPKPQDLIEGLFLRAVIDAYHRVRLKSVKKLIENDIRNLFIEDLKTTNTPLNSYIQHNVITVASENQANTKSLVQRTDIELHSNIHQIHFVIECKRLSSAETRYVQGTTKNGKYEIDGLEKFIHLQYAENQAIAAMVGFVVSGNIDNITSALKEKVTLFAPAKSMNNYVNKLCNEWNNSFQSVHLKTNRTELLLYHLFFDFSKELF